MDLCRVGTTSVRKRCVAAIWNMTNVEQVAHSGGSAAESIPMLLVRGKNGESGASGWVQEEMYGVNVVRISNGADIGPMVEARRPM